MIAKKGPVPSLARSGLAGLSLKCHCFLKAHFGCGGEPTTPHVFLCMHLNEGFCTLFSSFCERPSNGPFLTWVHVSPCPPSPRSPPGTVPAPPSAPSAPRHPGAPARGIHQTLPLVFLDLGHTPTCTHTELSAPKRQLIVERFVSSHAEQTPTK